MQHLRLVLVLVLVFLLVIPPVLVLLDLHRDCREHICHFCHLPPFHVLLCYDKWCTGALDPVGRMRDGRDGRGDACSVA
jgi:hypothetical protein